MKRRDAWRDRITPDVVDAFERVEAIRDAGQDEAWEDEGGRRLEMLDVEALVQRALGLPLWFTASVFDVDEGERPDHVRAEDWEAALTWRRRLVAASDRTEEAPDVRPND